MIPEYVYEVVENTNVNGDNLLIAYENFKYLKFHTLTRQSHKAFFFAVILLLGQGKALQLCEMIMKRYRIPKKEIPRYKHEYCIHYLNSLDVDKADKILLMNLIELEDNIQHIRAIAKTLTLRVESESKKKIFGYI